MSGDPSDQQISADAAGAWQFCQPPSVSICQGFQVGSSSCPPVEPFQSSSPWNPGFSEKPVGPHPRLDMGWNSPDPAAVARLGMFLGANPGMLPPSLSNFSDDSSFFERSARFSNFSAGGLGAMPNPFSMSGASASEVQIQNSEAVRGVSVSMDHGSRSECPMENHRDNVVSEEASPGFENVSGDSSSKGVSTKKRKKANQDMELDPSCPQFSAESPMENVEAKKKVEKNSATQAAGKSTGKNAKGSSDLPKEDYIHLRARCGQATNSHSLAERVRRERISQRMKYLQDLVPGCNKVIGKAVMLDEIINYVQSLQRQIEFLSIKLATVNPSVDFNIEGLLSKDLSLHQLLQSRGGPSSMGVSQELLLHPQLLSSQQCLIETGITELQTSLMHNAQFSTMNGFKEP